MKSFCICCLVLLICTDLQIFGSCQSNHEEMRSVNDLADFVTSKERCFQNGGHLARFKPTDDMTFFINESTIRMQQGSSYWIEVVMDVSPSYLDVSQCTVLTMVRPNKIRFVLSNCANTYRYICTGYTGTSTPPLLQTSTGELVNQLHVTNERVKLARTVPTTAYREERELSTSGSVFRSSPITSVPFTSADTSPTVEMVSSGTEVETTSSLVVSEIASNASHTINANCNVLNTNYNCKICCKCRKQDLTHETILRNNSRNITHVQVFPELELKGKQTSKALRKLSSATDRRSSSRAMGVAASFVIFSVVFLIVIIDIPNIMSQFKQGKRRRKDNTSEC